MSSTHGSESVELAERARALVQAKPLQGRALAEQALELARRRRDVEGRVAALHALGFARYALGDPGAMRTMQAAVRAGERGGFPERAALARRNLAVYLAYGGRTQRAVREIEAARESLTGLERARTEVFRIAIYEMAGRARGTPGLDRVASGAPPTWRPNLGSAAALQPRHRSCRARRGPRGAPGPRTRARRVRGTWTGGRRRGRADRARPAEVHRGRRDRLPRSSSAQSIPRSSRTGPPAGSSCSGLRPSSGSGCCRRLVPTCSASSRHPPGQKQSIPSTRPGSRPPSSHCSPAIPSPRARSPRPQGARLPRVARQASRPRRPCSRSRPQSLGIPCGRRKSARLGMP